MHKAPNFYYDPDPETVCTPEQRLCVAVLERAILDATGNIRVSPILSSNESKRKAEMTAKSWVFLEIENYKVMSFNWICDHLGLNPADIRVIVQGLIKDDVRLGPTDLRVWIKVIPKLEI